MLNLSLLMLALGVSAQTCQNIAGNYYCDQTKLVQFEGVGFSSSYNRVTSFNGDGTCSSTPQAFSGSLSPLDEELSVHFRGPIQLEHFQVYTPSGSNSKRSVEDQPAQHGLHHRHAAPEPEPVFVTAYEYHTDFVYVTAGASASQTAANVVTTSPEGTTSSAPPSVTTSSDPTAYNYNYNHLDQTSATGPSVITISTSSDAWTPPATTSAPASTSSSSSAPAPTSSSSAPSSGSGWDQIASYNAGAGSSDGLVFLNNLGGGGSGVFDFTFGNSLSYAGSDGVSCAASPQTLSQTTVGSDKEFIIFADEQCQGNDCGFYRPGTVAYHGFGGATKVFVFEFGMPFDGQTGFNGDMPAVWLLNAQIPRNLQYGSESCSCWSSGCGELDLWEVLNSGNDRMVATLHDKQNGGGGSANYFARPTQDTLKGAVVFQGTTISVVEIDEIPSSIDDGLIASWLGQAGTSSNVAM